MPICCSRALLLFVVYCCFYCNAVFGSARPKQSLRFNTEDMIEERSNIASCGDDGDLWSFSVFADVVANGKPSRVYKKPSVTRTVSGMAATSQSTTAAAAASKPDCLNIGGPTTSLAEAFIETFISKPSTAF
jgi:hypothetical protein